MPPPKTTAMAKVSVSDPRLREADIRKQVRLAWCIAGGGYDADATAAKQFGISANAVRIWRKDCEPDGQDWEQFRVELSLANHEAQVAMLASHDEVQVHAEVIKAAQRILGAVSAAINEGQLYDGPPPKKKGERDTRKPVTELWNAEGKVVPVGPMRPKSAGEAVRMLQGLSGTLDGSYRRVEQLLEMQHGSQAREDELFMMCGEIVRSLWGDDGYKSFMSAVAAAGETGEKSQPAEFTAEDIEDGEIEEEE